jgi:Flp pilus assembly pilin Flp
MKHNILRKLNAKGASLLEYGVLSGFISMLVITTAYSYGTGVRDSLSYTKDQLSDTMEVLPSSDPDIDTD